MILRLIIRKLTIILIIIPTLTPWGFRNITPIMILNCAVWLLGFSVAIMILNRLRHHLGRHNLAAQMAQLGIIYASIFQQITGFSPKEVLIRMAN